jgi:hypothetical protein
VSIPAAAAALEGPSRSSTANEVVGGTPWDIDPKVRSAIDIAVAAGKVRIEDSGWGVVRAGGIARRASRQLTFPLKPRLITILYFNDLRLLNPVAFVRVFW